MQRVARAARRPFARDPSLLQLWAGAALIVAIGTWAAIGAAGGMLSAGAQFPVWKLTDHSGAERKSSELAGKTYLMWFYPKAQTPGCVAEGRSLRDSHAELEKAGVTVLGVSADGPAANAAFVAAEQFPFPLLSDANLELAAAVGAADRPGPGKARRVSYLVGPDGRVIKSYNDIDPPSHGQQIVRDLRSGGVAVPGAALPSSSGSAQP